MERFVLYAKWSDFYNLFYFSNASFQSNGSKSTLFLSIIISLKYHIFLFKTSHTLILHQRIHGLHFLTCNAILEQKLMVLA